MPCVLHFLITARSTPYLFLPRQIAQNSLYLFSVGSFPMQPIRPQSRTIPCQFHIPRPPSRRPCPTRCHDRALHISPLRLEEFRCYKLWRSAAKLWRSTAKLRLILPFQWNQPFEHSENSGAIQTNSAAPRTNSGAQKRRRGLLHILLSQLYPLLSCCRQGLKLHVI